MIKKKPLIAFLLTALFALSSCSSKMSLTRESFVNDVSDLFDLSITKSFCIEQIADFRDEKNTRINIVETAFLDIESDYIKSKRKIKTTSDTDTSFRNQHYEETRTIFTNNSSFFETTDIHFYQSRYYSGGQLEDGKYFRELSGEYQETFLNRLFYRSYNSQVAVENGYCYALTTDYIRDIISNSYNDKVRIPYNDLVFEPKYDNASYYKKNDCLEHYNSYDFINDLDNGLVQKGNVSVKLIVNNTSIAFLEEIDYRTSTNHGQTWSATNYCFLQTRFNKTIKSNKTDGLDDFTNNSEVFKYI